MSKLTKPTYEELERRFQSYCQHDSARIYNGVTNTICAICHWDTDKCQHRQTRKADKFCHECGEKLK